MQEMKDERKQNVRFADIIKKPINIQFSKTDSDEESITNVSSSELKLLSGVLAKLFKIKNISLELHSFHSFNILQ